jgi:hypothetical protein
VFLRKALAARQLHGLLLHAMTHGNPCESAAYLVAIQADRTVA